MVWLIVLDIMISASAVVALGSRIGETENKIKENYNITPKAKKTSKIKNILHDILSVGLILTPGINVAILLWSCYAKNESFEEMLKNVLSKDNVLENKITKDIYNPKNSKFNLKNIFKKSEKSNTNKKLITKLKNKISEFAKDEKTSTNKNKINETPKEESKPDKSKELIDDLNTKVNETPKEEPKPFIRTALQPEGQLPFEIVWENDHVYSGSIKSMERTLKR